LINIHAGNLENNCQVATNAIIFNLNFLKNGFLSEKAFVVEKNGICDAIMLGTL
jgi:carbonic anhydrase/acetyltransferase-like protein (isoleucine patch superfamily)